MIMMRKDVKIKQKSLGSLYCIYWVVGTISILHPFSSWIHFCGSVYPVLCSLPKD